MADPAPSDASALCVSCGLCCTGILFTNARAEPEEVPRLRAAGLEVEQVGERLQFRLPCHHNSDGCCTIYESRFTKCRTFRCALLRRLDSGEVALPEALQTVAQAKAMVSRVAAKDSDAALVATRIPRLREGTPPAGGGAAAAGLWVESLALDLFLDRHFRNKPLVATTVPPSTAPEGKDK